MRSVEIGCAVNVAFCSMHSADIDAVRLEETFVALETDDERHKALERDNRFRDLFHNGPQLVPFDAF